MTKTINKLILILSILAFIFGLLLASPAYARTVTVDSGVIFNPYVQYPQYTNINQTQIPIVNTPIVIVGCDNRTTGFSVTTGQSCIGNYVSTSTTGNITNNLSSASINTDIKNSNIDVLKTNNTISNNNIITSNANENYGSLASTALLGSSSFMPSGLIQWIFFIILILVIIFLCRYLYAEEKYISEPVKHT